MYKNLLLIIFGAVCVAAVITIFQMWFIIMDWDTYAKLMITIGILALLAGFGLIVRGEIDQHKKMKDQNYLD